MRPVAPSKKRSPAHSPAMQMLTTSASGTMAKSVRANAEKNDPVNTQRVAMEKTAVAELNESGLVFSRASARLPNRLGLFMTEG